MFLFPRENQQPIWGLTVFHRKGDIIFGTNQKTHILRIIFGELSVFVDTGLGVWFVVLCCRCDPGDCLTPVLVWSLPLLLLKGFGSGILNDGVQTQRRGFVDPGERTGRKSLGECGLD